MPPTPRRDGAMSISSLLTPTQDDTTNEDSIQVKSRSKPATIQNNHSNATAIEAYNDVDEKTTSSRARRPSTQQSQRANEVDMNASMDTVVSATSSSFGKRSFRDFKYHHSMEVADMDDDKSDTDVDEDVYMTEKTTYLLRCRKRYVEITDLEADKRKVSSNRITFSRNIC